MDFELDLALLGEVEGGKKTGRRTLQPRAPKPKTRNRAGRL